MMNKLNRTGSSSRGLLILGMLLIAGCATPRPPHPTSIMPIYPPTSPTGFITHVVAPHETLYSIGKKYGISYREIMRINGLTDPAHVPSGQVLQIPSPAAGRAAIPLYSNPQWTFIVIHHSATAAGNAKLLDRMHHRRGFSGGLGYDFVIDNGTSGRRDGQIEVGPRWLKQQEGAHCDADGMNHRGIGICLVGNFTDHSPSPAQMKSLELLVARLQSFYGIPNNHVIRHRDVHGKHTACPGDDFPWAAFREQLHADNR